MPVTEKPDPHRRAKDRGKEPGMLHPMDQFPWFWTDGRFKAERVSDVHLTSAEERAARARGEARC